MTTATIPEEVTAPDPRKPSTEGYELIRALVKINRESGSKSRHIDLLYDGLVKLLGVVAADTRTECVYAALETMDILTAIDRSLGREPKFPGILRVPRVTPAEPASEASPESSPVACEPGGAPGCRREDVLR